MKRISAYVIVLSLFVFSSQVFALEFSDLKKEVEARSEQRLKDLDTAYKIVQKTEKEAKDAVIRQWVTYGRTLELEDLKKSINGKEAAEKERLDQEAKKAAHEAAAEKELTLDL